MIKLHVINTGFFKLDGGAMFGVVPKAIWNKVNPADEKNMCTWALRCLLVEYDDRLVLIDNGIGNKQSEKFYSHYYLHGEDSLEKSLNNLGFTTDDITDNFLTHLHFDHCGGSIKYDESHNLVPTFRNATYWINKDHWEWATNPNGREKASFLKENILPIQESGQLNLIEGEFEVFPDFSIIIARGHTDGMMIPHINYNGRTIVYVADLLPSAGHIPLPYIMGYDTRPLITLEEKGKFLDKAVENNYTLFFEHDPVNECGSVHLVDKRVRLKETFSLQHFIGN